MSLDPLNDQLAGLAAVSPKTACIVLNIRRRRLRQLVQHGQLLVTGRGHRKQITLESLAGEIESRKTAIVAAFDLPTIDLRSKEVQSDFKNRPTGPRETKQNGITCSAPDC